MQWNSKRRFYDTIPSNASNSVIIMIWNNIIKWKVSSIFRLNSINSQCLSTKPINCFRWFTSVSGLHAKALNFVLSTLSWPLRCIIIIIYKLSVKHNVVHVTINCTVWKIINIVYCRLVIFSPNEPDGITKFKYVSLLVSATKIIYN